MIKRCFELKDHLDTEDERMAGLVSTRREEAKLAALFQQLKNFESRRTPVLPFSTSASSTPAWRFTLHLRPRW